MSIGGPTNPFNGAKNPSHGKLHSDLEKIREDLESKKKESDSKLKADAKVEPDSKIKTNAKLESDPKLKSDLKTTVQEKTSIVTPDNYALATKVKNVLFSKLSKKKTNPPSSKGVLDLKTYSERPWLDIKTKDFYFKGIKDDEISALGELLDRYHLLNKNSSAELPNRIALLTQIQNRVATLRKKLSSSTEQSESATLSKALLELEKSVNGKLLYLKNIKRRKLDNLEHSLEFIFGKLNQFGPVLRTLRPKYYHWRHLGDLDPCRRGNFVNGYFNLPQMWEEELEKAGKINPESSFPSFYMWLEGKDNLTAILDPSYAYFDLLQQGELKVNQEKNILEDFTGAVVNTPEGYSSCRYAVDPNFGLHIFDNEKTENITMSRKRGTQGKLFHDDLLRGSPVLSAGQIIITNGKITFIDNRSGHYAPTPIHLKQVVDHFLSKGLMDKNALIDVRYFDKSGNQKDKSMALKDFNLEGIEFCRVINGKWMTTEEINEAIRTDKPSKKF